jgi:hypothetical protein
MTLGNMRELGARDENGLVVAHYDRIPMDFQMAEDRDFKSCHRSKPRVSWPIFVSRQTVRAKAALVWKRSAQLS